MVNLLNGLATDEQLVGLAKQGYEDAFAELVQRYSSMLQQQAAHFCHMRLDQEDLKQEGLLGLLSAVHTFDAKDASFRTYAAHCVKNRMISAQRQASREQSQLGDEDVSQREETVLPETEAGDPAAVVAERDAAARLYQKLHTQLTSLEYDVLLLQIGGYSYEEIAGKLKVSVKSVDNALQRVRRKWRRTEA